MLDFTRYEVLTFDCYGTLIHWEDGILRRLHQILAAHSRNADDAAILRLYGDFEASAEQGEFRCYRDVLHAVVQEFGRHFEFVPADGEAGSLAESLKKWDPWPDTIDA